MLKGFRFLVSISFCLTFLISIVNAQATGERPDPRSELVLVALSADGGQLAIARSSYDIIARNGRVELWDMKSGELRKTVTGFDGSISFITFEPDGKSIITTSTEYRQSKIQSKPRERVGDVATEIKWWDARSGEFIRKITLDRLSGLDTVLSSDGSTLAVVTRFMQSGGFGFVVELLGAPFENIRRFSGQWPIFESFEIKLFDAKTGARTRKMSGTTNGFANPWALQFVSSTFSPDGQLFAAAAAHEIRIWDVATGEKFQTIKKFDGSPIAITFSPDSKTVALASGKVSPIDRMTVSETEISVWEVATAKQVRNLRGKNDFVATLRFASNGNALMFGTLQYEAERTIGTVKVWDFVTNRLTSFNVHEKQKVSSLHLLPGKPELLLQSGEDIEVRDTRTWRVKQSFDANSEERVSRGASRFLLSVKQIVAAGFSSDGVTVSGVVPEEGLRLWDSRTGGRKDAPDIKTTNGLIARSPNGQLLGEITAKEIKLWEVSTGANRTMPLGTVTEPSAFALSNNYDLLAIGEGTRITLRNMTGQNSLRSLGGHEGSVDRLAFSNDARTLVSADESGTIKVWDVNSGELRQSISTGNIVTALAVDATGQLLASSGTDYLISVWNAATGALQLRLKKHENVVNALLFSLDGKTLASGGDDRIAVLWDVVGGKSKQTLKGHDLTVTSLAFSPDGQVLATGSGNASLVLWNVTNGKLDRVLH